MLVREDRPAPVLTLSWALILAALAVLPTPVQAAGTKEVTRSKSINAAGVASVVLPAGVGDVRIEQGSGELIEARVTLRPQRAMSFFGSQPDLEQLDIAATIRGDQLTLDVDAKNIEEDWVVTLPKTLLSALEVKVGVGDVRVSAPARRLKVDVGVGDVDIDVPSGAVALQVGTGDAAIRMPASSAGSIVGRTGVGGVTLRGFEGSVKSATVGGSASGKGRGQQPIEARVGVGDLQIELTD